MVISEAEKRVTAIHEAGHALLTVLLPYADPIHKVTIIPRGLALGLTQQLPMVEKQEWLALLVFIGGLSAALELAARGLDPERVEEELRRSQLAGVGEGSAEKVEREPQLDERARPTRDTAGRYVEP